MERDWIQNGERVIGGRLGYRRSLKLGVSLGRSVVLDPIRIEENFCHGHARKRTSVYHASIGLHAGQLAARIERKKIGAQE